MPTSKELHLYVFLYMFNAIKQINYEFNFNSEQKFFVYKLLTKTAKNNIIENA